MWEAIGPALKVFVEKELIPTIISVVGAILALVFCPDNYWVMTKIGKTFFVVLAAGIIFLAIALLRWIFSSICRKINYSRLRKSNKEYDKKFMAEQKDMLWSTVDGFSPDDRELLKEFIRNNNDPIVRPTGEHFLGNSLLNSNWVVSTEEYVESEDENTKANYGVAIYMPYEKVNVSKTKIKKYKLKDEIFNRLKWSYDNYGKISHFE